jgi:hypothetical protein
VEREVNGSDRGSCPVAGFSVCIVEPSVIICPAHPTLFDLITLNLVIGPIMYSSQNIQSMN